MHEVVTRVRTDITGVSDDEHTDTTGVYNSITDVTDRSTVVHGNITDRSTGVHRNEHDNNDDETMRNGNTIEHDTVHGAGNNDATNIDDDEMGNNDAANDDDISIEMEDHDDNHVNIDNLNVIDYMNAAQINIDPITGEHPGDDNWMNVSRHGYNLRP